MLKEQEISLLKTVARLFAENRDQVLERWDALASENSIASDPMEFEIFQRVFQGLMDDFITYMSAGNLEGYYESNSRAAKEISLNDIPYRNFIIAFHLFEDSCTPVLGQLFKGDCILKCISAVDHLHHNTIAVMSEEYFNVKDTTVTALVKLAELRDDDTGSHLERTREYLGALAKGLELDRDFIAALYKAGPLHDIGKVGIRDSILLKPFKLTREEFEEMKRHTEIGARTIEQVLCDHQVCRGYLKMARDIALYHHEKYDGSGYPEGLTGKSIPYAARIFALVDAYDAIVSKRPYKEPLAHEEAVRRIMADAGRHFDPGVVEAFLRVQEEFRRICEKYTKQQVITA